MQKILVANWKMNTTLHEAMELVDFYKFHLRKNDNIKIIICPPAIWLESISKKLKNSHITLGAQNIHYLANGAVTGEISAPMVKEFADYVIVGHSERKKFFHESNEAIHLKVKIALKYNLKPIVCVGEELKEEGIDHVLAQVSRAIVGLNNKEIKKIMFAYEPIWAIGTGQVATANHARWIIDSSRERLAVIYNREIANGIKFLYGGSVHSKNIKSFTTEKTVNGFLVGGASLETKIFEGIYTNIMQIKED